MITAVIDTNVLAAGFIRPEPPLGRVLMAWRAGLFTLIVSDPILRELSETFEEPYFRQHLHPIQRAANLELLRREALIVAITLELHGVASHPEDDLILATAASADADYPVTGDADLRSLGAFRRTRITAPTAFLRVLEP